MGAASSIISTAQLADASYNSAGVRPNSGFFRLRCFISAGRGRSNGAFGISPFGTGSGCYIHRPARLRCFGFYP